MAVIDLAPGNARSFGSTEALGWAALALAAGIVGEKLGTPALGSVMDRLGAVPIHLWFAFFVMANLISGASGSPIGRGGLALLILGVIGAMLAAVVTHPFTVALALTPWALYAFMRVDGDDRLRGASLLLLALCAHVGWAPVIYQLFAPHILLVDAFAVDAVMGGLGMDIERDGMRYTGENGHMVMLAGACSAFKNLSAALPIYISTVLLMRPGTTSRDKHALGIVLLAVMLMNAVRVALLASGPEAYAYWHDGAGVVHLTLGMTVGTFGLSYLAARWAGRRDR